MKTKKVLVNAYSHVNLGDDLFLKILFEKFPNTKFTLIGNNSKYEKIFRDDRITFISFPNSLSNKYIRKFFAKFFKYQYFKYQYFQKKKFLLNLNSEYDAVVTIGGSIFIENSVHNSFNFGNHKLLTEVFSHIPKFIIGSNFGPYNTKEFFSFFNKLFKQCDDVCFRDSYSKSLFDDLNNVRCFPDVVFSGKFKASKKLENTIGISIMDFSRRDKLSIYHENYQKLIVQILKSYIDKNFTPFLFSFCEYEGDERAISQILDLMDDSYSSKITKVFYKGNIDSFLESFSKMEIMYSSRFHAMILSMIYNQKIHPSIYSKKMSDVLDDLCYKGESTDLKNIKLPLKDFVMIDSKSFELDENVVNAADRQFEILEKFINS